MHHLSRDAAFFTASSQLFPTDLVQGCGMRYLLCPVSRGHSQNGAHRQEQQEGQSEVAVGVEGRGLLGVLGFRCRLYGFSRLESGFPSMDFPSTCERSRTSCSLVMQERRASGPLCGRTSLASSKMTRRLVVQLAPCDFLQGRAAAGCCGCGAPAARARHLCCAAVGGQRRSGRRRRIGGRHPGARMPLCQAAMGTIPVLVAASACP